MPGVPAETEIRDVLGRWDRGCAQHDARILAEITVEDFATTTAAGRTLTRADTLAGQAPEPGARLIFRDGLEARVDGGQAFARSRATSVATGVGPDRSETEDESIVLRRSGGARRLVSIKAVERPEP